MRAKHRAALRDMISVYKTGKGIKKDKKMEKLIKSEEEGKIDEWLAENLKIIQ
jgi:bacterioferritin (cytochrome b1)